MKRILFYMIGIVMTMAACTADEPFESEVPAKLYIPKNGLQIKAVKHDKSIYEYNLWVHKGGLSDQQTRVYVVVNEEYLKEYNKLNNTNYVMLPEKYCALPLTADLGRDELTGCVILQFDLDLMANQLGYVKNNDVKYVLPVAIVAADNSVDVNKELNTVLIGLNLTKMP